MVPASGKSQHATKLEEPVRKESQQVVDLGKSRVLGRDGFHQEEESSYSVFVSSAPGDKFLISLVFCLGNCFSTLVFLLQKKCRLQFDESDDEGMTDVLEAMTTPPSTTTERSSVAEEARVESSDHVDGARGLRLSPRLLQRLRIRSRRCPRGLLLLPRGWD